MQIEPLHSKPRQRYLAVAARLAGTQSAHHFAVSHVTIGAVAATAGVSRGALYRLWPSQQEFWDDLIEFLGHCPPHAPRDGKGRSSNGARRVESFSDIAQQVLLADTRTLLRTATAHAGARGATRASRDERRAARLAHLTDAFERWTATAGRRFTPGVAASDLAAAVTALGTGLPITGRMCAPEDLRFDSPWFDRPPDGPRTLLGVATEALRDRMTEPAERRASVDEARSARTIDDDATVPAPPPSGRRREYLQIGARLALTRDGTSAHRVLGHVTLDSVARAAGVTRRAVAMVWPDQDAFRLDLFAHLLADDRAAVVAAVRDGAAHHDVSDAAGDTFCAVGARMHRSLHAGLTDATFRAYATQLDEPALAARAITEHRRLADSCTVQVHRLLALTNRRLRPGVVGRHVAALLFALNDGFATLLRTSPTAVRDDVQLAGSDRSHSTIGVTVGALLDALTEPLDGSPEINRYVALIS